MTCLGVDFARYGIPRRVGVRGPFWAPGCRPAGWAAVPAQGRAPFPPASGNQASWEHWGFGLGVLLPFLDVKPAAQSEKTQSLHSVGCPQLLPAHWTPRPARGRPRQRKCSLCTFPLRRCPADRRLTSRMSAVPLVFTKM